MSTQQPEDKDLNSQETARTQKNRANPHRAVYVSGTIDHDLLSRVQPEILRMRYESNEPITVYINSEGGSVDVAQFIRGLLKAPNQEGESCQIITVATGYAASAAADLLASGDYAIAYPDAKILYHGSAQGVAYGVTAERATTIVNDIRKINENFASSLAVDVIKRYILRYVGYLQKIQEFRAELSDSFCNKYSLIDSPENTIDVCGFSAFLWLNLSLSVKPIATTALDLLNELVLVQRLRDDELIKPTINFWDGEIDKLSISNISQNQRLKFDMSIFQALLISQLRLGKNDLFNEPGWLKLYDEFSYVIECLIGRYSNNAVNILIQHKDIFLLNQDIEKMNEFEDDNAKYQYLNDIARQRLELMWFYVVTICRLLQQDDWTLTPADAFWLGLIDEILGAV